MAEDVLQRLFDPTGFVPRGGCAGWTPELVWVYNIADILIFLSYMAIPAVLIYFVWRRRDLPFPFLFCMFGAFIVLCGLDHLFEAIMTVHPMWRFLGLVKVATAMVSVATVFLLTPVIPKALALRSPKELELLNQKLEAEVVVRRRAEEILARQAAELSEANLKLRESERLKDEFLANVSHELRTPLTLVLSPLETLLSGPEQSLPPGTRPLLQTMQNNAVRLLQMVTGLLDVARLDAGKVEVQREPTDLAALTRSIVADFEPLFHQKGIRTILKIDAPATALAMDRYLYERILYNLLSNASKFTPYGGEVRVEGSWKEGRLRLCVTDTGIGIREEDQGALFQKFRQVEGSSTRRFEGSGLGLALVREFATLLGGTVSLASSPGRGSTFTVDLAAPEAGLKAAPVARAPRAYAQRITTRADEPTPASPGESAGLPKIVIAEDNAEMADYIARTLQGTAQTRIAGDGEEALALVREWLPDLLLTDVMMPRRDGFDLCRTIKADPKTMEIPVVLITAMTNREALLKGWEAGADEYLYKPFHPRELQTRTRSLLTAIQQRKAARSTLARQNAELERSNSELEQFAYLASHDLQEPLRTVISYTQLLAESSKGNMDPENVMFMKHVINASQRMRSLILDLLDYSRVGREAPKASVSLEEALGQALINLDSAIRECGASITHDRLPALWASPSEMMQLMQNLVGNAIKFRAPDRTPEIHIGAVRDGDAWTISVRDNGIGIGPGDRGQLFKVFRRLHNREAYPGTGIGLAICRKIVERLGGRIWVESEEGRGATFSFTLPVAAPS